MQIRGVVSLVCLALLSVCPPPAVAFAPSWTVQPVPTPTSGGSLDAVSCSSADVCVAVGTSSSYPGEAGQLFADSLNGGAWSLQPIPVPTGVRSAVLNSVRCRSAFSCLAVGAYDGGSGRSTRRHTLIESWNGFRWTIQPSPHPPRFSTGAWLEDVSCTSARACVAVGDLSTSSTTIYAQRHLNLAERWDGRRWTLMPSPPDWAGHGSGYLNEISCAAANACIAGSIYLGLWESWNGHVWSSHGGWSAFSPLGGHLYHALCAQLAGICVAIPRHGGSGGVVTVNRRRWSVIAAPAFYPWSNPGTFSCASASACVGVRGRSVETWNGVSWAVQKLTAPPPVGSTLFPTEPRAILASVSCPSASSCTAVGGILQFEQQNPPHSFALVERYG